MNEATKAAAVDRITQIAGHIGRVAPGLIMDLHDQITQAITALVEESQDAANEEPPRTVKPVITIPFSVKWDINRTTVEVKASVSTKTTAEASIELDDPNQPKLPGLGNSEEAVEKLRMLVKDGNVKITTGGGGGAA